MQASVVVARGLSSCGTPVYLLREMWDLPGPGIEPMSPVLAGGFLTTEPPGKSQDTKLIHKNLLCFFTLITNYQKELRKQSHLQLHQNNIIPWNKFTQGGEKCVF